MTLIINSSKVLQLSLEEDSTINRNNNEDSIEKAMDRHSHSKRSNRSTKKIVYLALILFVTSVGFIILFEAPYREKLMDVPFSEKLIVENENLTSAPIDRIGNESIIGFKEKMSMTEISTASSLDDINDADIERLIMMSLDVSKMYGTSIYDDDELFNFFPNFDSTDTYYYNYSGIDNYRGYYDSFVVKFRLALSSPDFRDFDDDIWNYSGDETMEIESKKKRSAEISFRKSIRRSENKTNDFSQKSKFVFVDENDVVKNGRDVENHRHDELKFLFENWETNWRASCMRLKTLADHVIIGDNCDWTIVVKIREKFVEMVKLWAWKVASLPSNETPNDNISIDSIIEDWWILIKKLEHEFGESVDVDCRKDLQINDFITREITNELRDVVKRLNRDYVDWMKIAIKSILIGNRNIGEKLMESELKKCAENFNVTFERINDFAVETIVGKSTDRSVVENRRKFVERVLLISRRLSVSRLRMDDQDWSNFMVESKKEITTEVDSGFERWTEGKKIIDDIYDIVENFTEEYARCDLMLRIFNYVGQFEKNDPREFGGMIDSDSTTEPFLGEARDSEPPTLSLKPTKIRRRRSTFRKFRNSRDDGRPFNSNGQRAENRKLSTLLASKESESSLESFFEKMEILSSHIDRLHERYMRLNELNDDYVSREFSMETSMTDDDGAV